jgi:nucleoside-diphosphate-sugar epimerase
VVELFPANDGRTEKAKRELGWTPHSFAEGIAQTWTEYRAGNEEKT